MRLSHRALAGFCFVVGSPVALIANVVGVFVSVDRKSSFAGLIISGIAVVVLGVLILG